MKKTETVAEFLAKGGKITIIPPVQPTVKTESIKSTSNGGPAIIMSMGEADLYYGEHKAKKPKKATAPIDLSALPEALRKKYVDEVINASESEEEDD
jgi:hypothetical protein